MSLSHFILFIQSLKVRDCFLCLSYFLLIFFSFLPESINYLSIFLGLEQLVEDIFESWWILKGPERLVLMAEDYFLKNSFRASNKDRNLFLNLGALMIYLYHLTMLIFCFQDLLQRFIFTSLITDCQERSTDGQNWSAIEGVKSESSLCHSLWFIHQSGLH